MFEHVHLLLDLVLVYQNFVPLLYMLVVVDFGLGRLRLNLGIGLQLQ